MIWRFSKQISLQIPKKEGKFSYKWRTKYKQPNGKEEKA